MKPILTIAAWTFVSLVIVYLAVNPQAGVIHTSPGGALGVGLIGLGLCLEARKRLARHAAKAADAPSE